MTSLADILRAAPFALAVITLGACGSNADQPANDAGSFAARIGSGEVGPAPTPNPAATVAPTIATPMPGAVPGPFAPGTLTDPASANCGANLMGPFIGKLADQPTRVEIITALGRNDNLRFVPFGSIGTVNPDPTNPRLSIMLDAQNIIRDARCG
ncbi:MAG: hypothetical protein CVT85_02090 [Alphaproteobacteria bacterium HGW-Alphaproteobacteria-7]|jgi:hypothetical protein|nr:MAG: hypothetical protein CVT85_02090 [Alphaproteobacteria bacterium HGW-Alphaproteobacteria-7]